MRERVSALFCVVDGWLGEDDGSQAWASLTGSERFLLLQARGKIYGARSPVEVSPSAGRMMSVSAEKRRGKISALAVSVIDDHRKLGVRAPVSAEGLVSLAAFAAHLARCVGMRGVEVPPGVGDAVEAIIDLRQVALSVKRLGGKVL
jgi:hypothetical protein